MSFFEPSPEPREEEFGLRVVRPTGQRAFAPRFLELSASGCGRCRRPARSRSCANGPPRGIALARSEVDTGDILAAAERAETLWPDGGASPGGGVTSPLRLG
jgi:hypothetical protein